MANTHSIALFDRVTQVLGNILLVIEEGLSRLYPREPRKSLSEDNYRFNRSKDILNEIIIDQNTGELTGINDFKIGKVNVGLSGCEIIAVNNALVYKEKECSFADIEREFELSGALTKVPFVPIGAYGSNPYALKRMIESFGLKTCRVSKKRICDIQGGIIFSYWNYGGLIKGLHTVFMVHEDNRFTLYNYGRNGIEFLDWEQFKVRFYNRFIIGLQIN